MPLTDVIVVKQGRVLASGASQANFAIGNVYLGYKPLGYLLEDLEPLAVVTPGGGVLQIDAGGDTLQIDPAGDGLSI